MTELRRDEPSARLEAAFTRIWKTRMQGLPFLNAALRVEAVGFRSWQGEWLGALVTPWFVNLLLLPGEGDWTALPAGGERIVTLPTGGFRFVSGRDEETANTTRARFSRRRRNSRTTTPRGPWRPRPWRRSSTPATTGRPASSSRRRPRPSPSAISCGRVSGTPHGDRG